jgi:hypothetical protein
MLSNPPDGKSWKKSLEATGGRKKFRDHRFRVLRDDEELSLITRSSDGQMLFLANMVDAAPTPITPQCDRPLRGRCWHALANTRIGGRCRADVTLSSIVRIHALVRAQGGHMSDDATRSEANRVDAEEGRENAEDVRQEADQQRDSAEAHRVLAEAARKEAEQFRVLAEEARALQEQWREQLESVRQEREALRHAAEEARHAAEEAREATMAAVAATADALSANLAQMQFLEDARNTLRQLKGEQKREGH